MTDHREPISLTEQMQEQGARLKVEPGLGKKLPVVNLYFPDASDNRPLCSACHGLGDVYMGSHQIRLGDKGINFRVTNLRWFDPPEECLLGGSKGTSEGCLALLPQHNSPFLTYDSQQNTLIQRVQQFVTDRFEAQGIRRRIINPSLKRIRAALR